MQDRVNTRIVEKPFLQKDVIGPGLGYSYRVVRSTVTDYGLPSKILKDSFGTPNVAMKLLRALTRDKFVMVTMTGDFVARLTDLTDQLWVGFGYLPDGEESRMDSESAEEGKYLFSAFLHPARERTAGLTRKSSFEFYAVIVFFNINT